MTVTLPTSRARPVGLALVAALVCAAPTVGAEVSFTFEGRGFGHGVGMSQYGARGAALQGWSAAKILGWYYRGTQITTSTPTDVRVEVAADRAEVGFGAEGGGTAYDPTAGTRIPLADGVVYTARMGPGGLTITGPDGAQVGVAASAVRITAGEGGLVRVSDRRYRGALDLIADGGLVDAVNTVDLESYLRGVLPREMPSSWGDATPAALQAQAIAARSYAITSLRPTAPFDLFADVRSQVYGGVRDETANTDAAVAATTRQVLTHEGAVVRAYYSSTSGGYTENVENSLGGSAKPYLVGVPDPYDDVSPLHRWANPPTFTATRLGQLLRTGGPVADIQVTRRGVSPRAMTVRVTGADGTVTDLTGNSVKARLDLRDTWFWIARSDQPAPAEPPLAGGNAPAPTTPAPTTPAPATPTPSAPAAPAVPRVGDFMVVASRQHTMRDARTVRRLVLSARPSTRIVMRRVGDVRVFLVVTGRSGSRQAAFRELAALRRLGYAAALVRARAGDPAVPIRVGGPPPAATASLRYRVLVARRSSRAAALVVARDLRARGRRPTVARRVDDGVTRFAVVTLRDATRGRAEAELRALRRLGYRPRLEAALLI